MPVTLQRMELMTLGLLLALALAVNADRFVYGAAGPLRAHDLADQTITAMASCGDFWRSGLRSTWDPTQLRGWPRAGSPMHAEMLMCVVGGIVPLAYIGPIFHALILIVIATGTYLFVRVFLRHRHEVAVAGCAVHVLLYFFFHEHPIVPSAILLPSLVGFLSLQADRLVERLILFSGAALVLGLSNPPPTLILMPLAHLGLIFVGPRGVRRLALIRWALFWTAYAIYYGPMMVALLREFESSSRSLYRPPAISGTFGEFFRDRFVNPAVLSPAAVLIALVGRRTWLRTLGLMAAIVGFIALTAANDVLVQRLGRDLPVLVSLSSLYYRMYYLVPVVLLVWSAWLFEDVLDVPASARVRHLLLAASFSVAVWYLVQDPMRVFLPYWKYAAVLAAMATTLPWWTRRPVLAATTLALVFAFGRYEFTRIYEVPLQGNLFVEAPHFGGVPEPVRAVTVMSDCDAVNLYPAQARAAGLDTLDGISNYYSRGYVERWAHFVANNAATCTSRYAGWSTRAELTLADLRANADGILPWLWINNVGYVRSPAPIDDPRLVLAREDTFTVDRTHEAKRFLYRFASPVGQVFGLPADLADEASAGDLDREAAIVRTLAGSGQIHKLHSVRLNGSHLRFSATISPGQAVVANINYHQGWTVRVDGAAGTEPVSPGPFGMIRIPARPGAHVYDLQFRSPITPLVPAFMALALVLLWLGAAYRPRWAA